MVSKHDADQEPAEVPGEVERRRWCVPPAVLRDPPESLEGAAVLDEVGGGLGVLLWQCVRDVTLWAAADGDEERRGLFSAGAGARRQALLRAAAAEPALELALTTLGALADDPGAASPALLTVVCGQVSRWAWEQGRGGTALAFAQAAALASPEDAVAALQVGRLALRLRRHARAESWLRRTIGLARRSGHWQSYAESYVELGELYAERAVPATARRMLMKAIRASRRHGLGAVRGSALQALFRMAVAEGRPDEAERLARAAIRAYGRGHPRLACLLHDLAALWVEQERYSRALPVLQRLLAHREEPRDQLATLALLARAAAGAGDRRAFEEAWSGAWGLLRRLDDASVPPGTMVELARGAAMVRDWERMEQAVRHARKDDVAAAGSQGGLERFLGSLPRDGE
jgi:tetratricopeptide (TPR) repeat protein